jgi:hypothetical protein
MTANDWGHSQPQTTFVRSKDKGAGPWISLPQAAPRFAP